MDPATAARAVQVAKALLQTNEEGDANLKKLIIGICIGVVLFLLLMYTAVEIFLIPMDGLAQYFLPENVREIKQSLNEDWTLPAYDTPKVSIMAYPVDQKHISSGFGEYRNVKGVQGIAHEGVDFDVGFGTKVMAAAPGVVAYSGVNSAYGTNILIQHELKYLDEDGDVIQKEVFYSHYAHLYKSYVFTGQRVDERQQIALSGGDPNLHYSGNSTGSHLHFAIRMTMKFGSEVNPYGYIQDPDPLDDGVVDISWG